jgi:hypothetical protein
MKKIAVLLALAQACTVALAQPGPVPAGGAKGANFICGGIGVDEAQAMKAQARDHSLMLTFAISTGAYLADVAVRIRDSRGATIVDTQCDGPIMLVDLPPGGTYRITAEVNGQERQKTIATRGRSTQATFVWPAGTS